MPLLAIGVYASASLLAVIIAFTSEYNPEAFYATFQLLVASEQMHPGEQLNLFQEMLTDTHEKFLLIRRFCVINYILSIVVFISTAYHHRAKKPTSEPSAGG